MKLPFLLLLLTLTASSLRANQAVDELLAAFQTQIRNGGSIDNLCDRLEDQDLDVLEALIAEVDKTWPRFRDRYFDEFEEAATQGVAEDRSERTKRIRQLRKDFMEVYSLPEDRMKPLLKSKSMPALMELRRFMEPTAEEIIAAASADLRKMRQTARKIARFRDALLDAAISATPADSIAHINAREKELSLAAADLPRDGLRVLKKNQSIAERDELPAEEVKGIEECNRWRLYVGLNALEIDPKLCDAARDHSKDMSEKKFFAHESPVPGKTTPWDRAKNFRTSASGENIYAGSTQPEGANKGWFFSPGHHKNMFSPGPSRIGLGRFNRHWTQMFGK